MKLIISFFHFTTQNTQLSAHARLLVCLAGPNLTIPAGKAIPLRSKQVHLVYSIAGVLSVCNTRPTEFLSNSDRNSIQALKSDQLKSHDQIHDKNGFPLDEIYSTLFSCYSLIFTIFNLIHDRISRVQWQTLEKDVIKVRMTYVLKLFLIQIHTCNLPI